MKFDLEEAQAHMRDQAKTDKELPGTCVKHTKKRNAVHFAATKAPALSGKELCRLWTRGSCRYGDKCKFSHAYGGGVATDGHSSQSKSGGGRYKKNKELVCGYCSKTGHKASRCFKLAKDKKKMARLAGETTDQEGQSKPEQVSATTVAGASAQEQQQSNEVRIDEACYAAHWKQQTHEVHCEPSAAHENPRTHEVHRVNSSKPLSKQEFRWSYDKLKTNSHTHKPRCPHAVEAPHNAKLRQSRKCARSWKQQSETRTRRRSSRS